LEKKIECQGYEKGENLTSRRVERKAKPQVGREALKGSPWRRRGDETGRPGIGQADEMVPSLKKKKNT